MSIPGPPHSDPPRCPGHTSVDPGSASSEPQRPEHARAPSSRSTARSGRAMSPTNSESPVSTAHGSGPRAVSVSTNAVCSGRCPGVCSARTRSAPSAQLPAVVERLVRVVRARLAVDVDDRAGRGGEAAVAGHVVGVGVRLEHVLDRHAEIAREPQVLVDVEPRIDDGGDARVVVADQVGGAAEIVVGDLSEDHASYLPRPG